MDTSEILYSKQSINKHDATGQTLVESQSGSHVCLKTIS